MIFTKGGEYPLKHETLKKGQQTFYYTNMTYWETLKQAEVNIPAHERGSFGQAGRASRELTSGDWHGSANFEDFMDKAKYGWSDGHIRVNEFVKRLENIAASDVDRPQASYDVQGSMVDIGKFVDGEPECMVDFTQQPTKKMVHLVVNLSASCGVSAETILRRGAAIVSFFNFLYRAGYSLKLTVTEESSGSGWSSSDPSHKLLIGVLVKDFHDLFDLEKIIMAVAHPSFFRRCLFGVEETYENDLRAQVGIHSGGGYGRVHNFEDKELQKMGIENVDIRLPAIDYDDGKFISDEQAYGWVKKTLAGLGINLVSL